MANLSRHRSPNPYKGIDLEDLIPGDLFELKHSKHPFYLQMGDIDSKINFSTGSIITLIAAVPHPHPPKHGEKYPMLKLLIDNNICYYSYVMFDFSILQNYIKRIYTSAQL